MKKYLEGGFQKQNGLGLFQQQGRSVIANLADGGEGNCGVAEQTEFVADEFPAGLHILLIQIGNDGEAAGQSQGHFDVNTCGGVSAAERHLDGDIAGHRRSGRSLHFTRSDRYRISLTPKGKFVRQSALSVSIAKILFFLHTPSRIVVL